MAIIERLVEVNDNPRAEILVDVQILEVNKSRTKQFGLDLGDYTITTVFSPEQDPRGGSVIRRRRQHRERHLRRTAPCSGRARSTSTACRAASTPPTSTLAVPAAAIRFLETDIGDAPHRQAAAARRRGAEADAEPRRGSAGAEHHLHAGGAGRRRRSTR